MRRKIIILLGFLFLLSTFLISVLVSVMLLPTTYIGWAVFLLTLKYA